MLTAMPSPELTDDDRWQAVLGRDRAHDGRFVTGVLTTGIYCRPSCPARHPRRENVRFFADGAAGRAAGLRACQRCSPDDVSRDERAVLAAIAAIKQAGQPLALAALAAETGYSPAHFQRVFTRHTGLSPAAYARALRAERAADALTETSRVTDAIYDAGFSGPSRFYAAVGSSGEGRLGMAPLGVAGWRARRGDSLGRRAHHARPDARRRDGEGRLPALVQRRPGRAG